MIISILIVVAVLSLLVFIHELGHFIAAKRSGVEVREFGFGFPPRLFGIKKQGTIFSINWIPVGGFVRLKGDIRDEGGSGNFVNARYGRKVKILLAGVGMNLMAAYLLLAYLAATGLPPIPGQVANQNGATYASAPQIIISQVLGGSPADKAGLRKGDLILAAAGETISDPSALQLFTKDHAGQSVQFEIKRAGRTFTQTIALGNTKSAQLGVAPLPTYLLKYSTGKSTIVAAQIIGQMISSTVGGFIKTIYHLPAIIRASFGKARPAAATGVVGPVGVVNLVSGILFLGWRYVLMLVVLISTSLAVINSLPIPALDGGRLLLITINKLAHRDLTKPVESFLFGLSYVFLGTLFILLTYLDIRFR